MVQTHCTSLEENKVEESLYYLFGQDYKGRSDVRWGANTTPARLHQRWPRRHQAYNVEEIYELDDMDAFEEDYAYANEYEDAEETYYEDATEGDYEASWDGQAAEETEDGYYQNDENSGDFDGALEEAYAAYLDARRQFANLRAARGYYPVVALAPDASPSSSGQQHPVSPGHGKGKMKSRGKGKSKGSSSKGRGKSSNPPTLKGLTCLKGYNLLWGICQLFHLWQSWTPCSSMPKRITSLERSIFRLSLEEDKDSRCDDGDRHGHARR